MRAFVSDLGREKKVSATTQTVVLSALLFLYREVLKKDLPFIEGIERAMRPERLPVVFTQAEVREVLTRLDGVTHHKGSASFQVLMGQLAYFFNDSQQL